MTYLFDTCILSKLRKLSRLKDPHLESWLLSHAETAYYISVLTLGEIQYGISKLPTTETGRKVLLEDWLLGEVIPRFKDRILSVDAHTVSIWGNMRGKTAQKGLVLPVIDSLLAATAIQHNLILVTENMQDFVHTGAYLVNPCETKP